MTTPPHHHDCEPGTLRCPECGEPARPVPPREWLLHEWAPRPDVSHLDGTALCPVYGPHGAQPATPIGAPARLTMWQAVRENVLAHADWTVEDHLACLDGEGYDTDVVPGDPAEVIARWLDEHRRTAAPTSPPTATTEARVHIVAGGDMVAVFADADTAAMQRTVMEAAGLDTRAWQLEASQWDAARVELRAQYPRLVITDVRPAHHGDPA